MIRTARHVIIPAGVMTVQTRAPASAAIIPWYLAGGVSASNCVGAWQAKGAASYSASLTNLANPGTYDLTEGSAPSWAADTGWTFDGGSQYLKTGVVIGAGWSTLYQYSNVDSWGLIGVWSPARWWFAPYYGSGDNVGYGYGGNLTVASPGLTAGNLGMNSAKAWRNGAADGDTGTSTSTSPRDFWIGCANNDGSALFIGSYKVQALAIYNTGLSDAQMAAVATAMAAL